MTTNYKFEPMKKKFLKIGISYVKYEKKCQSHSKLIIRKDITKKD